MGVREEKRFKKNKYLNKVDYCEIHINKYGFEEAKRLAIEFRKEMLKKMKI